MHTTSLIIPTIFYIRTRSTNEKKKLLDTKITVDLRIFTVEHSFGKWKFVGGKKMFVIGLSSGTNLWKSLVGALRKCGIQFSGRLNKRVAVFVGVLASALFIHECEIRIDVGVYVVEKKTGKVYSWSSFSFSETFPRCLYGEVCIRGYRRGGPRRSLSRGAQKTNSKSLRERRKSFFLFPPRYTEYEETSCSRYTPSNFFAKEPENLPRGIVKRLLFLTVYTFSRNTLFRTFKEVTYLYMDRNLQHWKYHSPHILRWPRFALRELRKQRFRRFSRNWVIYRKMDKFSRWNWGEQWPCESLFVLSYKSEYSTLKISSPANFNLD